MPKKFKKWFTVFCLSLVTTIGLTIILLDKFPNLLAPIQNVIEFGYCVLWALSLTLVISSFAFFLKEIVWVKHPVQTTKAKIIEKDIVRVPSYDDDMIYRAITVETENHMRLTFYLTRKEYRLHTVGDSGTLVYKVIHSKATADKLNGTYFISFS